MFGQPTMWRSDHKWPQPLWRDSWSDVTSIVGAWSLVGPPGNMHLRVCVIQTQRSSNFSPFSAFKYKPVYAEWYLYEMEKCEVSPDFSRFIPITGFQGQTSTTTVCQWLFGYPLGFLFLRYLKHHSPLITYLILDYTIVALCHRVLSFLGPMQNHMPLYLKAAPQRKMEISGNQQKNGNRDNSSAVQVCLPIGFTISNNQLLAVDWFCTCTWFSRMSQAEAEVWSSRWVHCNSSSSLAQMLISDFFIWSVPCANCVRRSCGHLCPEMERPQGNGRVKS